jgi:hypothetical protein
VTIAAAGGLIAIHHAGATPGEPGGWWASVGLGAPFVGAGLLGALGAVTDQPRCCVAAGLALWPMCLISVVGFPLLVPASVLLVSASRQRAPLSDLVLAALFAVVLAATTWFLVLHQDPATWTTPTSSGYSSNVITTFEVALSVTATAIVLVIATALTPRRNWRR